MDSGIEFDALKVLVADDSRLVCNTVSALLFEIGFKSSNITCAYKPNEVINHCKSIEYDIIICDYNFNSYLNGFQILEEIKYYKIIKSDAVFFYLTGENEPNIVRTIVDSTPDDYILKPFNKSFLASRISSSIKRKKALINIYNALFEHDYKNVIDECNSLKSFYPQYSTLIKRLKAEALVKLKKFNEAGEEYKQLLEEHNFDWIKTGLANTLIETDHIDQAKEVLSTLNIKEDNPYYHDEMSNISVKSDDLPKAISHLKQSTMLLDAGAERELIVSNLSLAMESYDDAFQYMKRYVEKNQRTYRSNKFMTLNYIRCFLYRFCSKEQRNTFESQKLTIDPKMAEINIGGNLKTQRKLIQAHICIIREEIDTAVSVMSSLKMTDELHFYDYYHWCYLLDQCSLLNNLGRVLGYCRDSIKEEQDINILRSQTKMFNTLEFRLKHKQNEIQTIKSSIKSLTLVREQNPNKYFEQYFKLKMLLPKSMKVSLAIINFIARNKIWPDKKYNIHELLVDCNHVVLSLMPKRQLESINYRKTYDQAKRKIESG